MPGGDLCRRLESLEALFLPDDEPIIINVIFGAQEKGELPSFVVEVPAGCDPKSERLWRRQR